MGKKSSKTCTKKEKPVTNSSTPNTNVQGLVSALSSPLYNKGEPKDCDNTLVMAKSGRGKGFKERVENQRILKRHKESVKSTDSQKSNARVGLRGSYLNEAVQLERDTFAKRCADSRDRSMNAYNKKYTSVDKWIEFSTKPRTIEDIQSMLFKEPDNVCISYVCRYSELVGGDIDRLVVLSTGFVNEYNVDKESEYNFIKESAYNNMLPKKFRKNLGSMQLHDSDGNKLRNKQGAISETSSTEIQTRVDWEYISMYQLLSEDDIRRYIMYLDIDLILLKKNLSKELRAELKKMLIDKRAECKSVYANDIDDIPIY